MVSAKCNRQRNMTWHGRGKIRSSANKTKLNLMSMVVKARIYYAIAIVERRHYIIVHIAIAIIPREIWIHHPAHNYIWGRGQSFVSDLELNCGWVWVKILNLSVKIRCNVIWHILPFLAYSFPCDCQMEVKWKVRCSMKWTWPDLIIHTVTGKPFERS